MLKRIARITLSTGLALTTVALLLIAIAIGWVFFYASDLPDIQTLSLFTPKTSTTVGNAYICEEKTNVVVVPTIPLTGVRNALLAAEGDLDRSMTRRFYYDLLGDHIENKHYGSYSLQLSRQLFCHDHRNTLKREFAELRTSVQLERRFTTNQLLDIYLNRAYFGPGVYGIENAAQYYLAKPADRLSTSESALLVGLIRSPTYFSPLTHPDRALARRNEVIDMMSKRGNLTAEQAERAKRMPLGIIAKVPPNPHS